MKKGDIVLMTETSQYNPQSRGGRGVIKTVNGDANYFKYEVLWDKSLVRSSHWYKDIDLKLADKFQKGDKVLINPNSGYHEQSNGDYGIVTRINASAFDGYIYTVDWVSANENSYKETDLIPYKIKQPLLKIGKYYAFPGFGRGEFIAKCQEKGYTYGMDSLGKWSDNLYCKTTDKNGNPTLLSDTSILFFLSKEAEKRGFTGSVSTWHMKNLSGDIHAAGMFGSSSSEKWAYSSIDDSLTRYGVTVFRKGKWAEIIRKPTSTLAIDSAKIYPKSWMKDVFSDSTPQIMYQPTYFGQSSGSKYMPMIDLGLGEKKITEPEDNLNIAARPQRPIKKKRVYRTI